MSKSECMSEWNGRGGGRCPGNKAGPKRSIKNLKNSKGRELAGQVERQREGGLAITTNAKVHVMGCEETR